LPLSEAAFFSVFSIAFAAATFAPASAGASAGVSFFVAGGGVAGVPIERTLALGFGASPPMLSTFGAPSFVVIGLLSSAAPAEPSAGRFAMVGVGRVPCGWGAACGCCA
jgi:hypothetical protein